MKLAVIVVLLAAATAHATPLGPGNPPRGCNDFRTMFRRAEWVASTVRSINPRANIACVQAVALELLGHIEATWSNDVKARGSRPRTVRKGEQAEFLEDLQRNAREQCDGPGGPGKGGQYETTKGLLQFADEQSEWTSANYNALRGELVRFAQGLAALGLGVSGAVQEALAVPASAPLPILNPELFMPQPPTDML